jgi:hypothetical protein
MQLAVNCIFNNWPQSWIDVGLRTDCITDQTCWKAQFFCNPLASKVSNMLVLARYNGFDVCSYHLSFFSFIPTSARILKRGYRTVAITYAFIFSKERMAWHEVFYWFILAQSARTDFLPFVYTGKTVGLLAIKYQTLCSYTASTGNTTNEWWIGKDMQGSRSHILQGNVVFVWNGSGTPRKLSGQ